MRRFILWPVFTVWWKSGQIEKNSGRSQKKNGSLLKGRWRRANIAQSGVRPSKKYRAMRCGKNSEHEGRRWALLDREVGAEGETLVWCRNCSGYARTRMGPKLTNKCQPEEKAQTCGARCFGAVGGRQGASQGSEGLAEWRGKRNTSPYRRLMREFEEEGQIAKKAAK